MLFHRVDATRTQEIINEKAEELGIEYRENSYNTPCSTVKPFARIAIYPTPYNIMINDNNE